MTPIIPLLEEIARTAERGDPLPARLRELGEEALATALERGSDLPTALGDRLDPTWRALLAGPRPGLAESALLAADALRAARERRDQLVMRLAHPAFTWLCLVAVVTGLVASGTVTADRTWLAAAIGVSLLALGPALLAIRDPWTRLADRYQRAALACRWRLTEERLGLLLGDDLVPLGPLLGRPGAVDHLLRLAEHHRQRARSRQRYLLIATAVAIYLAAGGLLLTAAMQPMTDAVAAMLALGGEP